MLNSLLGNASYALDNYLDEEVLQQRFASMEKYLKVISVLVLLVLITGCGRRAVYIISSDEPVIARLLNSEASYSVLVQDSKGDTVFSYNPDKMLVPASTMKLLPAAITWKMLGPEYRIPTFISYDGFLNNNILFGNLVVTGTGDPTIDAAHWQSPAAVFGSWADSLRAHGINEIRGDIIGDDDQFERRHLGSGWAWDDLSFSYGAEYGPLMANNTSFNFSIVPAGKEAKDIEIIDNLPFDYFNYDNEVTYIDSLPEHIHSRRENGTNTIRIYGNYGQKQSCYNKKLTAHNPTLYYAEILKAELEKAGIKISGWARDIDDVQKKPQFTKQLFTHYSPPLKLIIKQFLQYSNNQAGESLMRHYAWQEMQKGSHKNGKLLLEAFLANIGVENSDYRIADFCGLSRYDLLSASLLNKVLLYMQSEEGFKDCLARAGGAGTLETRTQLNGMDLRAKSGSMSRIECLSGYLHTANNRELLITVMVNNYSSSKAGRHPVDKFMLMFNEF